MMVDLTNTRALGKILELGTSSNLEELVAPGVFDVQLPPELQAVALDVRAIFHPPGVQRGAYELQQEAPEVARQVPGLHPIKVKLTEMIGIKFLLSMRGMIQNMSPIPPILCDMVSDPAGPMTILIEVAIEGCQAIGVATINLPKGSVRARGLKPVPTCGVRLLRRSWR